MALKMPSPQRRDDSGFIYFRQRIPQDVLPQIAGRTLFIPVGEQVRTKLVSPKDREIKLSLYTRDDPTGRQLHAQVAAYLEKTWNSIRQGPRTLTHKETVALAGEVYRRLSDENEDDPGESDHWLGAFIDDSRALEGKFDLRSAQLMIPMGNDQLGFTPEERFGAATDRVLGERALLVTDESRERLVKQVGEACRLAALKLMGNAEGDYSPDPNAKRFPDWKDTPMAKVCPKPASGGAISGILEAWWAEAQAAGRTSSTYESYRSTITKFIEHLGHDDAARVAPEDVIAFKDARLREVNPRTGKLISPKTVNDSDLTALKAVFGWAVQNRRMATNPAHGIRVKMPRTVQTRLLKGFTDEEAEAILRRAMKPNSGRDSPKLKAAKRWVPWLCAYTGSRVGEMVQLRKQDVRLEGGEWVLTITPEAGTVKDKRVREVVLHPHLEELGFSAFIAGATSGHLFATPDKQTGSVQGSWQATKNRLGEMAREVVSDPKVQPSHGWRHRFKTVGRELGISDRTLDAIQGHAPKTAGDNYGDQTLKVKAAAIRRFPRYEV